MFTLLDRAFKMVVKTGALTVISPNGKGHSYGDGTGTPVTAKITNDRAARRIAIDADLALGEEYMNGGLVLEKGTIYDLLAVLLRNAGSISDYPPVAQALYKMRVGLKRLDQYNPVGKAKANVAHHYDLSGKLYDLFLDRDRQYSCAYFESDAASLEDAQLAKKRHLAAKLDIKPGMKVLDIGSGWGGLGLYLAEICGADVTGVTLSEEQHKLSSERAQQRGVADHVKFKLLDYRNLDQKFDRIVSVGMFEHVGVGHYREFFQKVRWLLKDDGVATLHSINRSDGPGATSAWIKKYIFPGGYIPALSEVLPHIEKNGLYVTDIEILRLHYAKTLREWAKRFHDNRARAKEIYDERFCRMWEFYLAASECAFRYAGMNNFQIQFVKDQNVLPLTRGYIEEAEAKLRALEEKRPRLKSIPAE
ncbi:class I SAM-dependent methyltransferase [Aestuariivirga sp.]|uniref:class I SAM-dependent methyltransferase n=1 Tax=Aestuariivirga sp. TaxID=2650926 RepID=UPI0039E57337